MSDQLTEIHKLLLGVILPNLEGIMSSQAEQRYQAEGLNQSLEEFRSEMNIHFAELHAELAAIRLQLEDVIVTVSETEATQESDQMGRRRKPMIH